MTRQTKTPRQRAEDALGVADRRHRKALRTVQVLTRDLAIANDELEQAKQLHAYAQQHPALDNTVPRPTSTTPSTTTKEEGKA